MMLNNHVDYILLQEDKGEAKTGVVTFASGLSVIAIILVIQSLSMLALTRNGQIVISEPQSASFKSIALPTFAILSCGIGLSLVGVRHIIGSRSFDDRHLHQSGILERARLSIANSTSRHKLLLIIVGIAYGLVFVFTSNTLVHSAEPFTEKYGVSVPSSNILGCCGQLGSFPVITFYASEHFGFLLIPLNMILLAYLPMLVAINIVTLVDKASKKNNLGLDKKASLCGLSVGFFAGCPTCAGSIFLSLIGGGGSVATGLATAALAGYQPLFLLVSLASLAVAPLLSEIKWQLWQKM